MDTCTCTCTCCQPPRTHCTPVRAPQKQCKRKSLEKALAVASRKETKVAKTSAKKDGKKGLKKLWTNDPMADT